VRTAGLGAIPDPDCRVSSHAQFTACVVYNHTAVNAYGRWSSSPQVRSGNTSGGQVLRPAVLNHTVLPSYPGPSTALPPAHTPTPNSRSVSSDSTRSGLRDGRHRAVGWICCGTRRPRSHPGQRCRCKSEVSWNHPYSPGLYDQNNGPRYAPALRLRTIGAHRTSRRAIRVSCVRAERFIHPDHGVPYPVGFPLRCCAFPNGVAAFHDLGDDSRINSRLDELLSRFPYAALLIGFHRIASVPQATAAKAAIYYSIPTRLRSEVAAKQDSSSPLPTPTLAWNRRDPGVGNMVTLDIGEPQRASPATVERSGS
jgi:hypothetical protein